MLYILNKYTFILFSKLYNNYHHHYYVIVTKFRKKFLKVEGDAEETIYRKTTKHYHLVHRSQRDPLINDAEASSHVLVEHIPTNLRVTFHVHWSCWGDKNVMSPNLWLKFIGQSSTHPKRCGSRRRKVIFIDLLSLFFSL